MSKIFGQKRLQKGFLYAKEHWQAKHYALFIISSIKGLGVAFRKILFICGFSKDLRAEKKVEKLTLTQENLKGSNSSSLPYMNLSIHKV